MRMILAAVLATCGLAIAPSPAWSVPGYCPPFCDRIPDSAWIDPTSIPLYSTYSWPGLAGLAVTAPAPRFKFEEVCASPPVADDARNYAVAARAVVPNPERQWQLQVQVLHWRGEPAQSGDIALHTFQTAASALRNCQLTAPLNSPSITTRQLDRMAAVISGFGPGGWCCTNTCWPTRAAAPWSNWPCGRRPRRWSSGRRCPTRRCWTRWRRRCAPPISVRAGEAVRACRR